MLAIDKTLDILNLQFIGNDGEGKFLIINIDGKEFGINILLVQQIIRFIKPTQIPLAPSYMKGVINFSGDVIPVVDLGERCNLSASLSNSFTVIVIIKSDNKMMGFIVDHVSDIVDIAKENIQPITDISNNQQTVFLKGMGRLGERLILTLDTENLMDLDHEFQTANDFWSALYEEAK